MSTLQNTPPIWPVTDNSHTDSKYEKCLNITEEIYKRINLTFEIKKHEAGSQSDISNYNSDQIDSNDVSNGTDLFAYDRSSSIASSVSDITAKRTCDKYVNLNNNEVSRFKKTVPYVTTQRPRKRFRKRVKKRQAKCHRSDTDCSSDEGVPLSRIVVDLNTTRSSDELQVDSTVFSPQGLLGKAKIQPKKAVELSEDNVGSDSKTKVIESNQQKQPIEIDKNIKQTNKREPEKPDQNINQSTHTLLETQPIDFYKREGEKEMMTQKSGMGVIDIADGTDKEVGQSGHSKMCTLCNMTFRSDRGLKRHMTMSHITSDEISKKSTLSDN